MNDDLNEIVHELVDVAAKQTTFNKTILHHIEDTEVRLYLLTVFVALLVVKVWFLP